MHHLAAEQRVLRLAAGMHSEEEGLVSSAGLHCPFPEEGGLVLAAGLHRLGSEQQVL